MRVCEPPVKQPPFHVIHIEGPCRPKLAFHAKTTPAACCPTTVGARREEGSCPSTPDCLVCCGQPQSWGVEERSDQSLGRVKARQARPTVRLDRNVIAARSTFYHRKTSSSLDQVHTCHERERPRSSANSISQNAFRLNAFTVSPFRLINAASGNRP